MTRVRHRVDMLMLHFGTRATARREQVVFREHRDIPEHRRHAPRAVGT
jgi:hypothetical protein